MNSKLKLLIEFTDNLGVVESMHCYETGFWTVDGKTRDGKKFDITLHFEEEEKDA